MTDGEQVVASVSVGAAIMLYMPFPSLYAFRASTGEVDLQCSDYTEAALLARRLELSTYRYRMTGRDSEFAAGKEFHQWSGRVSGVQVTIVASPNPAIGPQEPRPLTADPMGALREMAEGVDLPAVPAYAGVSTADDEDFVMGFVEDDV